MSVTTIKVPIGLRDRISRAAKRRGVTSAALLAEALDELEKRQRWERVREAYASLASDDDYLDEIAAWDATVGDGLTDD